MKKYRGYKIMFKNGKWIFTDTGRPVNETYKSRPCGHCDKHNTKEGHDACLGILPGLMNACCGHGQENDAYVQFIDQHTVHGKNALVIQNILKQ